MGCDQIFNGIRIWWGKNTSWFSWVHLVELLQCFGWQWFLLLIVCWLICFSLLNLPNLLFLLLLGLLLILLLNFFISHVELFQDFLCWRNFSFSKPLMTQDLFDGQSFAWIKLNHFGEEVFELVWEEADTVVFVLADSFPVELVFVEGKAFVIGVFRCCWSEWGMLG